MIVFNTSNRSLECILGGVVTTNQLPYVIHYVNISRDNQEIFNSTNGLTNSTSTVTLLAAPQSGARRSIQSLSVFNADTATATITIRLNDNGTTRQIVKVDLAVGDHLIYTSAAGWYVLSASGSIKSTASAVNLNDLGDVVLTTPATGAALIYDGAQWVDGQLDLADGDARTGILPIGNGGTGNTTGTATTNANLTGHVTSVGNAAVLGSFNLSQLNTALSDANVATGGGTCTGTDSGTNTGDQTNISGNAATVTTNANLTGHVTSTGNAAVLGSFTLAQLNTAISDANLGITLATRQSAAGTAVDFTGIPAGVKRITVMFVGVSTNYTGLSNFLIQIGDVDGFETTGYLGASNNFNAAGVNFTTGFGIVNEGTVPDFHGSLILSLQNTATFTWVASGVFSQGDTIRSIVSSGSKSLSAELTQVRITTVNGTDGFDAGTINISYE